jgi:hypothetical protein
LNSPLFNTTNDRRHFIAAERVHDLGIEPRINLKPFEQGLALHCFG